MITETRLLTDPNYLWTQTKTVTEKALAIGALQPIDTDYVKVESGGVPFLVRRLKNLQRKAKETKQDQENTRKKGQVYNPFLPYESDLFVTDISQTHLSVLNKYNVVDHHLLIITRHYEHQDTVLTLDDFLALWAMMQSIEGLGFYNSGQRAGSSVHHKHLQLVPFPFAPFEPTIPMESLFQNLAHSEEIREIPALPFQQAFVHLTGDFTQPEMAQTLYQTYRQLLDFLKIQVKDHQPDKPYNLLVTRRWMFIVPRSQSSYQGIPFNSLGFAGGLLVKTPEQLELLKQENLIQFLAGVACQKESGLSKQ